VCVADCDATSAKATSLGATVCVAPTDIPGVGRLALFNDPQGTSIAILKPNPSMT
jgi:predicted enzyme related to lactoylglutathione lyase